MSRRPAYTLLELSLVLAVLAAVFLLATPMLRNARCVLAVRAARAELIAAIALTRAHAVRVGGAHLIVTPSGELHVERRDGLPLRDPVRLAERYGVAIATPRAVLMVLEYDALGIGRLTNTTLRIRRGDVIATITVSAYGRAR